MKTQIFRHPAIAEAARQTIGRSPLKTRERPWPVMDQAAYHGLAGEVVRTIEPHTEADPVAILIQFLTSVGNLIGRCPYYQVESDYHRTNLFCVMVGQSSKARKGTSAGRVHAVVQLVDEQWLASRVKGGLSSGEGLINEVRDEVKKWNGKEGTWEVVDPGVFDKRLMVHEPEFAGRCSLLIGMAICCLRSSVRHGMAESSKPSPKARSSALPARISQSLVI